MPNDFNFDALAQNAMDAPAGQETAALSQLYGHALALPQWHFLARGELPNINPYVASTVGFADGQPMLRAFTDTERLQRFVKEHHLEEADGGHMVVSMPTDSIVEYLEGFIAQGVHGIWFNSDPQSLGFFVPLKQLRPIKEHLERINWKTP